MRLEADFSSQTNETEKRMLVGGEESAEDLLLNVDHQAGNIRGAVVAGAHALQRRSPH